jgi:glutamate synthase domain-containing protein 2
MRFIAAPLALVLTALAVWATAAHSLWWLILVVLAGVPALVGCYDLLQRRHSVLRNYPIIGHMRFTLEDIRPEIQQYFIERDTDGRPFDRDTRTVIYERAKGIHGDKSYGTERDVYQPGYEFVQHSVAPHDPDDEQPRVRVGGPDCEQPYDMALLNVSGMSFGALSGNAIRALNAGAALGGFAHDTGEGGISKYHRENGGDLVWEIGTGYFGCRTRDGHFDADKFRDQARSPQVKTVSLKLSQGAKPGLGGVLPGPKVSAEIAAARGVPQGEKCVSPASHNAFHTPREMMYFLARLRELSGGKPVGFKLCVGSRRELLAICKAMAAERIVPDFVIVDGSEGGTGAAPLEFEDHVGMPLTEGLITVHNALVGVGLRDRIRIGASGKIASGVDIVKRCAQGADYTNAARAMMMAVGCIQSQRCHTNHCPVGVTTQDPKRTRALDVGDKSKRVYRFQQGTVAEAQRIIASMGLSGPGEVRPSMLYRQIDQATARSFEDLYHWLEPGELLDDAPEDWARDWDAADPDSFAMPRRTLRSA